MKIGSDTDRFLFALRPLASGNVEEIEGARGIGELMIEKGWSVEHRGTAGHQLLLASDWKTPGDSGDSLYFQFL